MAETIGGLSRQKIPNMEREETQANFYKPFKYSQSVGASAKLCPCQTPSKKRFCVKTTEWPSKRPRWGGQRNVAVMPSDCKLKEVTTLVTLCNMKHKRGRRMRGLNSRWSLAF